MSLFAKIQKLRVQLLDRAGKLSFLAPLLLRVSVGLVFLGTGWGKLHNLDGVTEFFTELGIPFPALNAKVVACTELFGGIALVAGLGTRLVALPLAFTMLIAILTDKRSEVDGLLALVGLSEWSYLVTFVAIAIMGPGALSADRLLGAWLARRAATDASAVSTEKPAVVRA